MSLTLQLEKTPSPCMGICRMDVGGVYCQGCRRTAAEIGYWSSASEEAKRDILASLEGRDGGQAVDFQPWAGQSQLPAGIQVLQRGDVSSNNIVFVGPHETAVVDTGYGPHARQTLALIRGALAERTLDRIVISHTHADHIGGVSMLQRAYPGVEVTIPDGDAKVIGDWDEAALYLAEGGRVCERFAFDRTYSDGDRLELGGYVWRAVSSPGHHMASLVLYCEELRMLISADALWEKGFGTLIPEFAGEVPPGAALKAQRDTLDAIAAMRIDLVIPGHGAPFTDVGAALGRAYERLDGIEADLPGWASQAARASLVFLVRCDGGVLLEELPGKVSQLRMARRINERFFGLDEAAFAHHLVAELEERGLVRREGTWVRPT
jgi:glyoxylase-like metal-dependent hydrolase (beta-lactamase superfamily II)